MNKELLDLMKIQGDIRLDVLMRYGMNQVDALEQAGIILDMFLQSDLAKAEYKKAYSEFPG